MEAEMIPESLFLSQDLNFNILYWLENWENFIYFSVHDISGEGSLK